MLRSDSVKNLAGMAFWVLRCNPFEQTRGLTAARWKGKGERVIVEEGKVKFRMGVTLKNVFRSIGPPGFPRLVPMCLHVEMRFPQIPGNVKKKKRIVFFFVLCAFVFVCLIFFHSSFSKAAMRERTTFLLVSTDSPFKIISSRIAYTCSPERCHSVGG